MSRDFRDESIVPEEQTGGTETSQYLQEEKENLDSLSSGERTGNSPNRKRAQACARCAFGVVGRDWASVQGSREVTKFTSSRTALERPATAGDSPVGERRWTFLDLAPEYRGTREILWESGGTTPQG